MKDKRELKPFSGLFLSSPTAYVFFRGVKLHMNINSQLKGLLRSKYAKIITVLLLLGLTTTAFATVYVFFYANTTSTIRGTDVTLAAGPDASGSCTIYPCATVSISGTSDTTTVTMSMFKADNTFTPPPSSYYSNLVQVKDATNTHSIKAVQILSIELNKWE